MQFAIVPGAVVPDFSIEANRNGKERIKESRKKNIKESGREYANEKREYGWRAEKLPEQGGVGPVPLPIIHQGMLPICTGVAAANARSILHYQQTGQMIPFSGLFIYKMNRLFDGLPRDMKGSTLEASMQTLRYKGVCPERLYPSNQVNCSRAFPTDGRILLQRALPYRIERYGRCADLQEMLAALAQGHPVVFSMVIYTDFYEARRGVVPPKRQGSRIGGHSMVAVQYDLQKELLQVAQSWGTANGGLTDRGYMYIPFSWFDLTDTLTDHSLLIEAFALEQ